MKIAQWDLVRVRINPGDRDEHPALILTADDLCVDPAIYQINVLYGSTRRPAAPLKPTQFVLNGADGLEHATVFTCSHIYSVDRRKIASVMGCVSPDRRRPLARKIIAAYRFPL